MVWPMIKDLSVSYTPFEELHREMNRYFGENLNPSTEYPMLNVWTNADTAVVTAEIPGVDPQQLSATVTGNILTLEGERAADTIGKEDIYLRRERECGKFVRTLQLPFEAEESKVQATYKLGVLTITLPRKESTKPKKITISG